MNNPNWVDIAGLIVASIGLIVSILGVAAAFLTAVSILFVMWQIIVQNRQMHRDFESLYIERYWAVMDLRSPTFSLGHTPTESDSPVIYSYLQLSEDEIDQRRLGRVTDGTWELWGLSIGSQTSESPYASALCNSNGADFPLVRELLSEGPGYDPLKSGRLKRKWKGL